MNLNVQPYRLDLTGICTLCNLNEVDNIEHFIGICPILIEIRRVFFNVSRLNRIEIIEILNGKNWLVKYVNEAIEYRTKILKICFEI